MAAENQNGGRSPSDNSTKVDRSLDDLARDLATSNVSRGRALKIMGSALLGSVLAAVPGVAWANDRCSEGQTRCGERCVNLQSSERHCGSCSNRCPEGSECVDGVCQEGEPQCGPGIVCNQSFTQCGQETGQDCFCTDRLEGGTVCGQDVACGGPSCTSSDECVQLLGPGAVCQTPDTGCCGQVCVPACGMATAAVITPQGGSNSGIE
jgi:hypothetical protein